MQDNMPDMDGAGNWADDLPSTSMKHPYRPTPEHNHRGG